MSDKTRKILAAFIVVGAVALALIAFLVLSRPVEAEKPEVTVPAIGLAVPKGEDLAALTYLLQSNEYPFEIISDTTVAVRPDDLPALQNLFETQEEVNLKYAVVSTTVPQPSVDSVTPIPSPGPTQTPSESPSGSSSPSPSGSNAPSGQPTGEPTASPTAEPSESPEPPPPTTPTDNVSPEDSKPIAPIKLPESELLERADYITGVVNDESSWSRSSQFIGAWGTAQIIKVPNAQVGSEVNKWIALSVENGKEDSVAMINPTGDPTVFTSIVRIPQSTIDSLATYVGAENVKVSVDQTLSFAVALPVGEAEARKIGASLSKPMAFLSTNNGVSSILYYGPALTYGEMDALGKELQKYTGEKPVAVAYA